MKKLLSIILVAAIAISGYKFFVEGGLDAFLGKESLLLTEGTDEQKIEYTVEKYEECYNNGDFDGMTECCTGKVKTSLKAQMGLMSGIFNGFLGKLLSYSVSEETFKSIWGLGTEGLGFGLETVDIYFFSETSAEVELIISESGKNYPGYVGLEKEENIWYISTDFYQYSKVQ